MEMNSTENEIEKTLQSLDKLNPVVTNPLLYELVMSRLDNSIRNKVTLQTKIAWRVAACLTLFIFLNIFTFFQRKQQISNTGTEKNAFTAEYFSYINQI